MAVRNRGSRGPRERRTTRAERAATARVAADGFAPHLNAYGAKSAAIHQSAPFQESSRYYRRDLYRGPDRRARRAAVSDAIGIWRQEELWRNRAEAPGAAG